MIINEADNVMYGDTEVSKVYCGDALVWERGGGRVLPTGYRALEFFSIEERYSCNTELRPTSGVLGFELKVAPHAFSDPTGRSAVYIGGFWSEPSSTRDDVSNWLTIVLGGQVRLRQWISNSSHECVYSSQGAVQLDTPCVISGRFQRYPELSVNGTPYELLTPGESVLQRDTWLCSNGAYGDSEPDADVYYCKLWDGDTLARDMVPVQRESDDAYGMWDFVTEDFYEFVQSR